MTFHDRGNPGIALLSSYQTNQLYNSSFIHKVKYNDQLIQFRTQNAKKMPGMKMRDHLSGFFLQSTYISSRMNPSQAAKDIAVIRIFFVTFVMSQFSCKIETVIYPSLMSQCFKFYFMVTGYYPTSRRGFISVLIKLPFMIKFHFGIASHAG